MKDFFAKIWAAIKAFFISLWGKIKVFFSELWNKVVAFLDVLPSKYYLYSILGLVLCSFFGIVIPNAIDVPAFVLIFLFAFVNGLLTIFGKKADWLAMIPFSIGALIIQIFIWL